MTPDSPLAGRSTELELLDDVIAATITEGASLVLEGDPGVGKTALLSVAAEAAAEAGLTVLGVTGIQFEPGDRFAGLRRLLQPLDTELARARDQVRSALGVALGIQPGSPARREALSSATLELLRSAAEQRPVLMLVDDAMWVDVASAEVISFVARRVAGSRLGVVAAQRLGSAGPLTESALPRRELRPLSTREALKVLTDRYPQMDDAVATKIVADSGGLPLALVELPLTLTSSQRAGAAAMPDVLPVDRRLEDLFGTRIRALSPRSREEVLLAALEGSSGNLTTLSLACPGDPELLGLTEAEQADLVRVDELQHRVTFVHPLVRGTVVHQADPGARRAAHRALAEASPTEQARKVWHLAAAADGPDELVADLLEKHAAATLGVGDVAGAMAALQKAAELSPTRAARAHRQVQAAFIGADVSGDLARASDLLRDADSLEPQITGSLASAVTASYLLLNGECDVDTAHRILADAIDRHLDGGSHHDPALPDALHSLVMLSWFGGRQELWRPYRRAAGRLEGDIPLDVDLCHRMFGNPVHLAPSAIPQLETALRGIATELDPIKVTRLALAGVYTDRLGPCREALWRVIRDGRQGGAVALAINALVSSCVDDWLTGQWDEAIELVDEGMRLCEQYGYRRYSVILGGYISQLVRVCRGDLDGGRVAALEMAEWAADRGAGMTMVFAHHLQTLRAIALEDYESAYAHASAIAPAGDLPQYAPHALWGLFDMTEAAFRSGRPEAARSHVDAMQAANLPAISARLAMMTAGSAALVAEEPHRAADLFEQALATRGSTRWPFDRARIQLSFGERLHHDRHASEARTPLREALAAFEMLSAQPWARRARRQLRAAGETSGIAAGAGDPALTDQELVVARLAAEGLTNRQIGERVYLSHRSVGAILYRVFPKLGVTSRAALYTALERITPDSPPTESPPPDHS